MDFSIRAKELFTEKWPRNIWGEDGVRKEETSADREIIPVSYRCGHVTHLYLSGDREKCLQRIRNFASMDCPKCHRAEMNKPKREILKPVMRETFIISGFLLRLLFRTVQISVFILLCILVGGCYYCAGKTYPNLK